MTSVYGIEDVALSMPAIVGKDGVECLIPEKLSADEQSKLRESAKIIKDTINSIM